MSFQPLLHSNHKIPSASHTCDVLASHIGQCQIPFWPRASLHQATAGPHPEGNFDKLDKPSQEWGFEFCREWVILNPFLSTFLSVLPLIPVPVPLKKPNLYRFNLPVFILAMMTYFLIPAWRPFLCHSMGLSGEHTQIHTNKKYELLKALPMEGRIRQINVSPFHLWMHSPMKHSQGSSNCLRGLSTGYRQ